MNTLSGRSGSIDLTKCMATCAVLMIHCSANRYQLFTVGSLDWLTVLFWNGACKWAVPVFLMCSGALMNDPQRELPLNRLFSRYLLRLVASLSVWAALYECLRILILRGSAPLSELLWAAGKNWFTGNTYYHLYYFYFAIGLYLALPLTRLITRWASKQELRYLLLLWLFFGSVLPCLQYFLPFRLTGPSLLRFILSPVFASAGLGLLGWYLHQKPAGRLLPSLLLFLAGFAALFFFTWQHSDAEKNLNIILLDGFSTKEGKTFPTMLELADDGAVNMQSVIGRCPHCGGEVRVGTRAFNCSNYSNQQAPCSFAIWRNIGGHQLTLEEAKELCEKNITSSELEMYREDGSIYRKRLGLAPDKLQIVKI